MFAIQFLPFHWRTPQDRELIPWRDRMVERVAELRADSTFWSAGYNRDERVARAVTQASGEVISAFAAHEGIDISAAKRRFAAALF